MLQRDLDRARRRPPRLLAATLLLAACSTLPPAAYPEFADHLVAARFVVPEGGLLRLPVSGTDLVVQELTATPPPQRELFGHDGERWFVYPAGTHVHVRCRCRSYAAGDARPRSPAQLLPGAHHIEVLGTP